MSATSPRFPIRHHSKPEVKMSPRSNLNISPLTSLNIPGLHLNEYSIASPRLTTLESERSQLSARKKVVPVPSLKSSLHSGPFNNPQSAKHSTGFGLHLKQKKEVVQFFMQKGALKDSKGNIVDLGKSYSTMITPRGEGEIKSARDGEIKSYRGDKDEGKAARKEKLLMSLIKKEAEAHDLRQFNQHTVGPILKQEEEKSFKVNKKPQCGYNTERATLGRMSLQNIMEADGDGNDDRKKKGFKGIMKGEPTYQGLHAVPYLALNDMSLDSRSCLGTTLTLGSLSKLNTKANPRTSPNEIMQQLSARSQQRGESVVKTARIQALKSIYDSQPEGRKSNKKFRLKRRLNNSLNRLVLAEGTDSSKEIKTERTTVVKQNYVKGNIHKTVTTEADSKMSNFSVETTVADSLKKEKKNVFQHDLAGLLNRFKKLLRAQNEQKEDLKEKTLTMLARITELESKGLLKEK